MREPEKGRVREFPLCEKTVTKPLMAQIVAIHRYPVKGLSPEALTRTTLSSGLAVPCDRLYAIENGPSGFDPANPSYFPKQRFLMLMRNARLAELRTRFDDATHTLAIRHRNREVTRGDLRTAEGCAAIETFFAEHCGPELNGPPRMLHAEGHSFSDVARKVVSIINLASVAEIENAVGATVNPLRFRGNLHVAGWPAWSEFDLLNATVAIGRDVRLKVVKRIVRCAATEVDPDTGVRDLPIPRALMKAFGHSDCGVYAEVVQGGEIAIGDEIAAADSKLPF